MGAGEYVVELLSVRICTARFIGADLIIFVS
jgi:hypothetical protein